MPSVQNNPTKRRQGEGRDAKHDHEKKESDAPRQYDHHAACVRLEWAAGSPGGSCWRGEGLLRQREYGAENWGAGQHERLKGFISAHMGWVVEEPIQEFDAVRSIAIVGDGAQHGEA